MLPTLVSEPPSGEKWLHEIKHDGYRTQLHVGSALSHAYTRNGHDWSHLYRHVLRDAERLTSDAVMDGEIVIQDESGRADFDGLKEAIVRTPQRLIFYAFDLLYSGGADLRNQPLIDRRERLQELIGRHDPGSRIQFSEHVIGDGPEFFDVACGAELEGIVSKKITSRYRSGRSKAWLKTKAFVEGEFVVIGHRRDKDRSLALLASETPQGLEYVGSAFVTLSDEQRELFWRSMEQLATTVAPAPVAGLTGGSWVQPALRVTAQHLRCSGKLRHATLKDLHR